MSTGRSGDARHDLGDCSNIVAESVGRPGQRTFRLRATCARGNALVWLEKQQLYDLAISIKQVLKREVRTGAVPVEQAPPSPRADHDFRAMRLAIGHDAARNRYVFYASPTDDDLPHAIKFTLTESQLDDVADQALDVHAGGRPKCPLCGAALNEGEEHHCPRSNGHSKREAIR
ncbi:MAG: DUF3090 family protein [SAR202 cluster bacterium]|nr:DUF3090 family protein [SAR202 cluster bacterium]